MIIRLTQKLGRKIGVPITGTLSIDPNPFADWSANMFTVKRIQYILITNTASLYSVVMAGRGISNGEKFVAGFESVLGEFLRLDGNSLIWDKIISQERGSILFAKSLNRSVVGSMNDMIFVAKSYIGDCDLSLYDVSRRLNQMPMSLLDHDPRTVFGSQLLD